MSSKLIKGPGFGRSVPAIIELPYPAEQILKTVTVLLKADGSVELHGAVGNLEFGQHMLDAGRARLEQWHAQLAKRKAEEQAKTEAFLAGAPAGVEPGTA